MKKRGTPTEAPTVIYGIHPVLETVAAGKRRVDEIYCVKKPGASGPADGLAEQGLDARAVSPAEMLSITGTNHHQGLAAKVGPFPYADLDDALKRKRNAGGPVLILDEVQDPANLGNILRSAECLGALAVVIAKDRSVPVTPVVEKASAGATAHMAVARVVNLVRAMEELRSAGYWIYGTAADAAQGLYSMDLTGPTAFVLGSEGKGMRRLVRESCDGLISVPMTGKIASLNVAQTGAIILSECLRQRLAATSG